MASTKTNQTKANTSRKTQSKKGQSKRNKNSSDDTMKFLLVLVIAGIAIAMIFFMQPKEKETGNVINGTPTPTVEAQTTVIPEPTSAAVQTPEPTKAQENTDTPQPTSEPEATPEPTATPTPTPVLSAEEAKSVVTDVVDVTKYNVQLINDHLRVGNGEYYQFGAIYGQEFVYPFLVVNKADGSLHFYDSTDETVFDFTTFPLETAATATPTPTPEPQANLTAEQAYQVLCTYSKESLHIAKEVSEYNAEYDNELTLVNGVNCYRINLSEVSGGKVRNRGEFYVSVDGKKCYYIDSDTNEFVPATK